MTLTSPRAGHRTIAVLALLAALLASMAARPVPAAAAAPVRDCGSLVGPQGGAGIYSVKAADVACNAARSFAARGVPCLFNDVGYAGPCTYRGWRCAWKKTGYESARTRCARGSRLIVWRRGS